MTKIRTGCNVLEMSGQVCKLCCCESFAAFLAAKVLQCADLLTCKIII